MSYRPIVNKVTEASNNDKDGLYEFMVNMEDGTQTRVFYQRYPEWKLTNISRLLRNPCPICRKDFICKCMDNFTADIHNQLIEGQFLEHAATK
ncbi:hypothetical protein J2Z69_001593 [Paenibacillus shirakamiensis]|uniref:Uncharacterized protein n=1 Tax=Paenibacillus shirakamiensis TaxID=1265935 RepID=A0ABS4JFR5_9BACL|nr:hypothetical protein [Paenibacillus shirakamiensis]MBP2000562.1 hypothetical protein [Paenibacillus shirakamiensis]